MINTEKLNQVISAYKANFSKHFEKERYKWNAVKCFQENWDIETDDLAGMLKKSFSKTENLLAASYYYPFRMIWEFAKKVPKTVKEMFDDLFDEKRNVTDRINKFLDSAEYIRKEYDPGTWKNHYQNINTISVYLTLKYPRKYSFYKNNIYKAALELTDFVQPKGFSKIDKLLKYYEICDEIYEIIKSDTELIDILNEELSLEKNNDYSLHLLVQDILYYHMSSIKTEIDSDDWFPSLEEYTPGLSKEQWLELLSNGNIIGPVWGGVLAAFYGVGGSATCSEIAIKYNTNAPSIGGICTNLAKRIQKEIKCPLYVDENGQKRYWSILFQGKYADSKTKGVFIWKLRPELFDALTEFDIMRYEWNTESDSLKYSKSDLLNEVYITPEQYDTLAALLEHKKNVILQGAPGVGKTFTAKRLAYAIMGEKDDSRIEFVQFHQSYSYEDFIMGYRPTDDGSFQLRKGVFYRFCDKARNDPNRKYFFIIDEINRGNLSKIFGEMLMLIEVDKRGDKLKLTYQKEDDESFSVPDNLYIIGMMNTADRSLAMIDYALRRRFSFFEMSPGFDSEGFKAYSDSLSNDYFNALIAQIKLLNKDIEKDSSLGKGFCIGHSYFCNLTAETCTDERLREIVEYDVIPMLSEYWFDDRDKADKWSENMRGLFNDD